MKMGPRHPAARMTSGSDGSALGDLWPSMGQGYHSLKTCNQNEIFSPIVRVSHKIPHHISDRLVTFIGFSRLQPTPFSPGRERGLEINMKIDDDKGIYGMVCKNSTPLSTLI